MSEYSKPHHIEKLIGSSPGYVGYGTDTKLVRELKKNERGILLFDEIEKAHKDVLNGLLHILDAGIITSGAGEVINLKGYIIIMTSNALTEQVFNAKNKIGFDDNSLKADIDPETIRSSLVSTFTFSPEFVNRIDSIVVFDELNDSVTDMIIKDMLEELKKQLLISANKKLVVESDYIEWIKETRNKKFGGRDIRRIIESSKRKIARLLMKKNENSIIKLVRPNE